MLSPFGASSGKFIFASLVFFVVLLIFSFSVSGGLPSAGWSGGSRGPSGWRVLGTGLGSTLLCRLRSWGILGGLFWMGGGLLNLSIVLGPGGLSSGLPDTLNPLILSQLSDISGLVSHWMSLLGSLAGKFFSSLILIIVWKYFLMSGTFFWFLLVLMSRVCCGMMLPLLTLVS